MEFEPVRCKKCGRALPKTRLQTVCGCIGGEAKVDPDCIHLGDPIGTIDCGCAGKPRAYWCNHLNGHCTLTSPGKWWDKVISQNGKISRVGKLDSCLHCSERNRIVHEPEPIPPRKSDRVLVTVATGDKFKEILDLTRPSLQAYAARIGADYREITTPRYKQWHHEKLRVHDYATQYERMLFIDADCVIRDNCPNLFDLVAEDEVGIHDDYTRLTSHNWLSNERKLVAASQQTEIADNASCLNSGVVVTSRHHADIWQQPKLLLPSTHCSEQIWVEHKIASAGHKVFCLPWQFNCQWYWSDFAKRVDNAYIVHFANADRDGKRAERVREFLASLRQTILSASRHACQIPQRSLDAI